MNSKKRRHTCPLCGSVLSREKYEQVRNIDRARRMDIAHLNADLAKHSAPPFAKSGAVLQRAKPLKRVRTRKNSVVRSMTFWLK